MSSGAPKLVVSLHDVHPGSRAAIAAQREALAAWGVPRRSLLVVPRFHHGPSVVEAEGFAEEVRSWAAAGDEIVLHGYYHDREGRKDALGSLFWTRLYTNREAEFLDLSEAEAAERIREGLALFKEAGFPEPEGFIAPAWLMSAGVHAALWKANFRHTTTLRMFLSIQRGGLVESQSLCWSTRAAWRRVVSVWWNDRLFARSQQNRLLRVSLHPNDLLHVTIRKQIERLVKTALDRGFEPVTYAAYAALQG